MDAKSAYIRSAFFFKTKKNQENGCGMSRKKKIMGYIMFSIKLVGNRICQRNKSCGRIQ